jgi:hypothetical protein
MMKFRRNKDSGRTHSTTPNRRGVFSYYASRSVDTTSTNRAGRVSKQRWHYLPSLISAICIAVSLVYILTLDTNPKMALASAQQNVGLRTPQTYQQAAKKLLNSSWFNRNKLTIDTGHVERELKKQFPELSEVAVTLPLLGHRPVVELAAVQSSLMLVTHNGRFILATNGKAITAAADTNSKDLPTINDDSGLSVQAGTVALPASQISFIQLLTAQLKLQKQTIQSMSLPPIPNEVNVRLEGTSYYIKFNTALDARQQVGTYLAAKQKLDKDHVTPAEYMDVRVEEKVFFK